MKLNWILCHGHPDRCLSIQGYVFPLCARCTAIYFGLITGLVIELLFGPLSVEFLLIYIAMIAPTGADGLTQLIFDRESTNLLRITTGYPAGIGPILFLRTASRLYL